MHRRFLTVLAIAAFVLTLLFALAAGAQEGTSAEEPAGSAGEQTMQVQQVQSSQQIEAQDVQTQAQGCRDQKKVETVGPTSADVTESFNINGDKFRVTYDVTFDIKSDPDNKFEVEIKEGSRKVRSNSTENDVNNRSFTVNEGSGNFKLETTVTPKNGADYNLTVQDCRGDNSHHNNNNKYYNINSRNNGGGKNKGGGNNKINTARTPTETTTGETNTANPNRANPNRANTNTASPAAETTTANTAANADFANRPNSGNFRCELFFRSFTNNPGAVRAQYSEGQIVQRLEQCLSGNVLPNTIPNRNLPFTGGLPLLGLAIIGLIALIAGIAVFRAVMRRVR